MLSLVITCCGCFGSSAGERTWFGEFSSRFEWRYLSSKVSLTSSILVVLGLAGGRNSV